MHSLGGDMNDDVFMVHTISVVLLKLANLIAGILLCFLGKGLFERGIKTDFTGEGNVSTVRFRLVTSSPGAVFLLAGLAIVISSVVTQTQFVESSEGRKVESRFMQDEGLAKRIPSESGTLSPEASELRSMLTMYTQLHGTASDDKVQADSFVKQIPTTPPSGSVDFTRVLLRQLFDTSPSSLLRLLNDPRYHWILENATLVGDLSDRVKAAFDHK